jgi:hypothetical protein
VHPPFSRASAVRALSKNCDDSKELLRAGLQDIFRDCDARANRSDGGFVADL